MFLKQWRPLTGATENAPFDITKEINPTYYTKEPKPDFIQKHTLFQ